MDLGVLKKITAADGFLILPQNQTEKVLLECVRATGKTEVLLGHEVKHFQQDNEGVSVEVQQHDGGTTSYRGRYLVGCDGAHSTVRGGLGWRLEGKTTQRVFFWLTFALMIKGINFHGRSLRLESRVFWQACVISHTIGA